MFIFTYPIIVFVIASILRKQDRSYPKLIGLSLFTVVLGTISFIIVTLNLMNFLNLDNSHLYEIINHGGIFFYVFSAICLVLHFTWPHRLTIARTIEGCIIFLFTNLIILAVFIFILTFFIHLLFVPYGNLITDIGYSLSGLLLLIYILKLIFKYTKNKTNITLWLLALLSIFSFILRKNFDEYELYISYITNICVISFFVIILIKSYKKIF